VPWVGHFLRPELDSLLPVRPGTVFKVDVEGFEYCVIEGAKNHLSLIDCRIIIELHGWGDKKIRKYPYHVLKFMRHAGFKV
jgi:hypothetical protein